MTETGWIIVVIIALAAILLVALVMRRKPAAPLPGEVAADLIPEQVQPEPPAPSGHAPSEPHAATEPGTSFPQEPLASIVPPVEDVAAPPPIEDKPVEADLSGALAENAAHEAEPAPAPEAVATEAIVVSTPPVPAAATVPVGDGDNLLKLKGVGPKIATLLKGEGITRFAQIAAWTDADLAAIDTRLGSFAGRPKRDNWVDQASFLAAGDVAGYEAKYGKL